MNLEDIKKNHIRRGLITEAESRLQAIRSVCESASKYFTSDATFEQAIADVKQCLNEVVELRKEYKNQL